MKPKHSILLLALALIITSPKMKAQEGFEKILIANTSDAEKLAEGYIKPAMKGLIYGMSTNWYHTAKVHKKFGFDLTISANASIIPSKDEIFSISDLNLSSTITKSPTTSPTLLGDNNAVQNGFEITIPANSNKDINNGTHPEIKDMFSMPGGIKNDLPLSAVPTPVVQLNLGLPGKFEASLRLLPKMNFDAVDVNLFGLGIKKEITSWFGPAKKLPLHVSIMGAFSNMGVSYGIETDNNSNIVVTDGALVFKLNSYTVETIASLNFPIINIYGGIGFSGGSSSLNLSGTYNIGYSNSATKSLTNPFSLNFNASGFKTTTGIRLSLGFFKIFAQYTLQEYSTASAGIALNIR